MIEFCIHIYNPDAITVDQVMELTEYLLTDVEIFDIYNNDN